jgi:hypothetical protein
MLGDAGPPSIATGREAAHEPMSRGEGRRGGIEASSIPQSQGLRRAYCYRRVAVREASDEPMESS